VSSNQSNITVVCFLSRIVQSCSQDGGCTAADCSSVSVELLDPTKCKCTELVEYCVLDCVALVRGKVFLFLFSPVYCVAGNLAGIKFGDFSHNVVF